MNHQLDATLCRFYFCRVTLHVSGASAHHQEYLKLERRPLVHVLSLQVSHHISLLGPELEAVLNTPDDGRLRPKHVEWLCRNSTCTVLHQVGVSFDWFYTVYYFVIIQRTRVRRWVDFVIKYVLISAAVINIFTVFSFRPPKSVITL